MTPDELTPGDIIWTPRERFEVPVRHYGVVIQVNPVLVAHASMSQNRVVIDSLAQFLEGSAWTFEKHATEDPGVIYARARATEGRPYSLFMYNCEHFVTEMCEGKPRSPQLRNHVGGLAIGVIGVTGLLLWMRNRT